VKAIVVEGATLAWRDVPDPVPGADEVLLRVHAASVNRADLAQRAGRYPPPEGASDILGLDVAGEVLHAPAGSRWSPGDRAMALVVGGGYAEHAAVPSRMLMPIPTDWSFEQAASIPEVHLTAYLNLVLEAHLRPGERLLIHGGASGVGTAAIQQSRAMGALVATTSSASKRPACLQLGANLAFDRRDPAWSARLRDAWRQVDVVLDMVGAGMFASNLELLATGGRLVWIATPAGSRVEVDVRALMIRRLTLKGSTLRSRPLAEKITLRDAFHATFGPALARGAITPLVQVVTDVRDVEYAHSLLRANATIGKVVLRIP